MTFNNKQKGMSVVGLLLLVGMIGFVVTLAFRIAPHYLDYLSMRKSIEIAGHNQALGIESVDDFYSYIGKNMQVNDIQDIDLKKALTVKEEGGRFNAHLKYEQRERLFLNLDLVIKFDEQFSVAKP